MAAPTETEITVICVDISFRVSKSSPFLKAQLDAIRQYCVVKFQCNPENQVGLFIMSAFGYGFVILPTNDLGKILCCLQGIHYKFGGRVNLPNAVKEVAGVFRWTPPNIKRRVLAFVGSPINLYAERVSSLGWFLKKQNMALDVVYFLLSGSVDQTILSYNKYDQCSRKELAELITTVNDKDNSQLVDAYVGESSVWDILSKSILKKNIRYLRKKEEKKEKKNVNVKQEQRLTFVNDNDKSLMISSYCSKVLRSVPENDISFEELLKRYRPLKEFQNKENVNQCCMRAGMSQKE